MSFEREFESLMPDTVLFKAKISTDDYGNEVYGSVWRQSKCRVEYIDDFVRRADGESIKVRTVVYIPVDTSLSLSDKVRLPDGSVTTILMLKIVTDEDGPHHMEVYCGE